MPKFGKNCARDSNFSRSFTKKVKCFNDAFLTSKPECYFQVNRPPIIVAFFVKGRAQSNFFNADIVAFSVMAVPPIVSNVSNAHGTRFAYTRKTSETNEKF